MMNRRMRGFCRGGGRRRFWGSGYFCSWSIWASSGLTTRPGRNIPCVAWTCRNIQGAIDWDTLCGEGISFAYIKATEGSSHVDPRFADNWMGARGRGLRVGAYHFFSFDSPGDAQAQNFIARLPAGEIDLPPVVDVELYGKYRRDPKPADEVWAELKKTLDALEAEYGVKPRAVRNRQGL